MNTSSRFRRVKVVERQQIRVGVVQVRNADVRVAVDHPKHLLAVDVVVAVASLHLGLRDPAVLELDNRAAAACHRICTSRLGTTRQLAERDLACVEAALPRIVPRRWGHVTSL
jgi:hypothetical protein